MLQLDSTDGRVTIVTRTGSPLGGLTLSLGYATLREKRQHPRAALDTTVEIFRVLPEKEIATGLTARPRFPSQSAPDLSSRVEVRCKDISNGGMFINGVLPFPIGTQLLLSLELPGLGQVELPGFVRWHRADGFGIQFGPLGARETHAIGRIVRSPVAEQQ